MRELRWYAEYADGKRLVEWEQVQGKWKETSFKLVDPRQVIKFGLEGSGLHVWFGTGDGCVHVNEKPLKLWFQSANGDVFPVTHHPKVDYRGLIQFKEGSLDLGLKNKNFRSNPCLACNIGYNIQGNDPVLGMWQAQLLVRVPTRLSEAPEGTLHFACEQGFRGRFYISYGEKNISVATVLRPKITNRIKLNLF